MQDDESQPVRPTPVPPRPAIPTRPMAPPAPPRVEPPPEPNRLIEDDPQHHVILILGNGLKITIEFAFLMAGVFLTFILMIGCFWIILAPSDSQADTAAFALLSGLVAAWVATLGQRGNPRSRP